MVAMSIAPSTNIQLVVSLFIFTQLLLSPLSPSLRLEAAVVPYSFEHISNGDDYAKEERSVVNLRRILATAQGGFW